MKILAVYNLKGGVGKTATSVNLAYLASAAGINTLLIDLDPQAAASFYFGVESTASEKEIKSLVKGDMDIERAIIASDYPNLDILPSGSDFRKIENFLSDMKHASRWLEDFIKPVKKNYELIIIDCAPNMTMVTENIFRNADHILVPVVPTVLSVRTYEQILAFFKLNRLNKDKLMPFFSMFEKRKSLHTDTVKDFSRKYKETISVLIPYSSEVEKMGIYRAPIVFKRPSEEASKAFGKLWRATNKRMNS